MLRRLIASIALCASALAGAAPIPTPVQTITDPRDIAAPANPQAGPVPIEALAAVRTIGGAAWAPDGRSVVVSANISGRLNLWRIDPGAEPVRLTTSDEAQRLVAVTPDGMVIYLQDAGGDELYDIYQVPLAGGAPVNLTNSPDASETDPILSPDGAALVFSRRDKTGTALDLFAIDRRGGAARRLTQEAAPSRMWRAAGFTDGGRGVIASREDALSSRAAIYRVDRASGRATQLTVDKPGIVIRASGVSPDGRTAAVTANEQTGQLRAEIMDLRTGVTRVLKPTPWEQIAGAFAPDGAAMIVQTNVDGRTELALANLATGAERSIALPPGFNTVASGGRPWSREGRLLVLRNAADTPGELWSVEPATGRSEQLTRLSGAALEPAILPKSRIVAYRSTDGTPISAILTMPFNLARDGSHPAIVVPHGGPRSQATDLFSAIATAFASRGYLVLRPNFRGSTGYGRAFEDADLKDLGGGDLEDVVAGARFLVGTGYVDPRRIGITGASYGGFMTLMALGKRPDVFAAGVNECGILNWFSMWENSLGGLREFQRALVGDPVRDKALYDAQSPLTYARNIRAPLLNLQGENDVRVPRGQTDDVVAALKADGRVVEAVYYPGEGHGLRKRENQLDALRRRLDWFDTYLKPTR